MSGFCVLKNNNWSKGFDLHEYRFLNESMSFENITAFRSTLKKTIRSFRTVAISL